MTRHVATAFVLARRNRRNNGFHFQKELFSERGYRYFVSLRLPKAPHIAQFWLLFAVGFSTQMPCG